MTPPGGHPLPRAATPLTRGREPGVRQWLPRAFAWAEARAAEGAAFGMPLTAAQRRLAATVGVRRPDLIRIREVDEIPLAAAGALRGAALAPHVAPGVLVGLTLGYCVWVVAGQTTSRLLSHEFRHVQQFEAAGSIRGFLSTYLGQLARHGYRNAPLEIDARRFELDGV